MTGEAPQVHERIYELDNTGFFHCFFHISDVSRRWESRGHTQNLPNWAKTRISIICLPRQLDCARMTSWMYQNPQKNHLVHGKFKRINSQQQQLHLAQNKCTGQGAVVQRLQCMFFFMLPPKFRCKIHNSGKSVENLLTIVEPWIESRISFEKERYLVPEIVFLCCQLETIIN